MPQAIKTLPIGSIVKFAKLYDAPIKWRIADHNHDGYPSNSTTLISKDILKAMSFDAAEPASSNADCKNYGDSIWSAANLRTWANSSAEKGKWYSARHSSDQGPDKAHVVSDPYLDDAGFLSEWTDKERGALLTTTHKQALTFIDGKSANIEDKIFVPSEYELNITDTFSYNAGSPYRIFLNNPEITSSPVMTAQCANHAQATDTRTPSTGLAIPYWTTNCHFTQAALLHVAVQTSGRQATVTDKYAYSSQGFVPACNVSGDTLVSDSTDSDGCYQVIFNTAPSTTGTLTVPAKIDGGEKATIAWGRATDADGNLAGYILESKENGAAWKQIYKGSARTFDYEVPFGTDDIVFRVKAYDTYGAESAYITSNSASVHNNVPPEIVVTVSDLGELSMTPPTFEYTVTDADNDSVTVDEMVDGKMLKSYTVSLGTNNTFSVDQKTWNTVLNGTHKFSVKATDPRGEATTADVVFTKRVTKIQYTLATPRDCDTMPTKAVFTCGYSAVTGSTFKVEACNNGYDANPTWEDVTEAFLGGTVYEFTNKTKTADKWGINCRYTIDRGTATGILYCNSDGGNYE